MKEGVEAWNTAFEEAGFRNAVRAEMLPDSIEAGDIRYATLRWNASDQPGYGAIGPSIVDPRTGEILDADMLYEANMFLSFRNTYRDIVDPHHAIDEIYSDDASELEAMKRGIKTGSFFNEMGTQANLMRAALLVSGEIRAGEPMPDDGVFNAGEELFAKLEHMHGLLADPSKTSVRVVLTLEQVVIKEAQRSFTYFHLYGYPTDLIVANRVLPAAVGSYFDAWSERPFREFAEDHPPHGTPES
jgi:hypothetical protein